MQPSAVSEIFEKMVQLSTKVLLAWPAPVKYQGIPALIESTDVNKI
jgi:hypothetical protein